MLSYRFSKERSARTKQVDFGILSADTIRKMSVCEVTSLNIYHRGVPMYGGVNDTRVWHLAAQLDSRTPFFIPPLLFSP